MARARNIKPGIMLNEQLASFDPVIRLSFIYLWMLADREGRLEDRPLKIKATILPYEQNIDMDSILNDLANSGFIVRYVANNTKYIQITNFTKHQNPHHKEIASEIPPPSGQPAVTKLPYDVPNELREAIFERDGNKCLCCGSTEKLAIDHIIPLSKGGTNDEDNLQTLCTKCNSVKHDSYTDYRKVKHDSCITQAQTNHNASCPPDSLIPDSLIPDTNTPLNPPLGENEEELPSEEEQEESDPPEKKPQLESDAEEIFAFIVKKRTEKFGSCSYRMKPGHLQHIRARLKEGYTAHDLKTVFAFKLEDKEAKTYADYVTPFREANFQRYLEQARLGARASPSGKQKPLHERMTYISNPSAYDEEAAASQAAIEEYLATGKIGGTKDE